MAYKYESWLPLRRIIAEVTFWFLMKLPKCWHYVNMVIINNLLDQTKIWKIGVTYGAEGNFSCTNVINAVFGKIIELYRGGLQECCQLWYNGTSACPSVFIELRCYFLFNCLYCWFFVFFITWMLPLLHTFHSD